MRRTWLLALCACVGPSMDPAGPDVDDTSGDSAPEVAPGEDDAVTWHADVRPIVERSCLAGCHEAGGVGPFSLEDDPADWARGRPNWAPLVVQAVASGAMPPWPASDDCHPLEGSRRLADDEVERFVAWERDGYLPGVPTRFVPGDPPEVIDLGTPDHLLDFGGAYRPDPARPDDYRCLLLGDPLTEDLLVRAIEVWPGERDLVHHAILFEITPGAAADEVAARDAADPGPGFTCFGSPVVGADFFDSDQIFNLHTYAPGQRPEVLGAGEARRIVAGSRLVLQVHYNTLGRDPAKIPTDDTRVAFWDLQGEPTHLIRTLGLPHTGIRIPAGDPEVVQTKVFPVPTRLEVVGILGHMHQLGTRLDVQVLRRDGSTTCALDLPRWDFSWQLGYRYPEGQPLIVEPGDKVQLTCVYDNSEANQPVVNGVQQPARTVGWGDGTLDEMCLTYPVLRQAVGTSPTDVCDGFEGCFGSCPEGDGVCLGGCLEGVADACTVCALPKLATCADPSCTGPLLALAGCLKTCTAGQLGCIVGACRTQSEAYLGCQDAFVRAGDCDAALAPCGVDW